MYEGNNTISYNGLILLQPLGADQVTRPHMKAMDVPFHIRYGSLICTNRLQSDRPKCTRMLAEAGAPQAKTVRKTTVVERHENRACLSFLSVNWLFLRVR